MDLSGATIMCQHKKSPQALRRRGRINEPLFHYDLVACSFNRSCSFGFECSQQNFFVKKYAVSKPEKAGNTFFKKINPFLGLVKKLSNFFDGKIRGVHNDLLFPILHFSLVAHHHHYTNLLIFTKSNLTIKRR
jgi:hypothetical protein